MNRRNDIVPLVMLTAAFAISLVLLRGLLGLGVTEELVPSPEDTADSFVGALQAGRFTGARNLLAEDLKMQVEEDDLRSILEKIEQAHGGIEDVQPMESSVQGDQATAQVEVSLKDGETKPLSLSLIEENYVWKISSLDALQGLSQ